MASTQKHGSVTILVGAQWGDEGKGKWIDILSEDVDVVARYQGGNNAGHTLYINGVKTVLHQIPSGVFRPKTIGALAAGVVLNPVELMNELNKLKALAQITPDNLWLSARSHVITPWHIELDSQQESASENPIGTTKRGIGPTYALKAHRTGLRLGDYIDPERRQAWFTRMAESTPEFKMFFAKAADQFAAFTAAANVIAPFVCDAESRLRKAIASGKRLLLEGAQGTMLDLDHGTYPYVTSSSTTSGGACASIGFSPKAVEKVIGVAKAYVTRVGSGPMPTELNDDVGTWLGHKGQEFGATTGRKRRCGWLDAVALRYASAINGFDGVILNKMDILTGLDQLKICTAYKHPRLGVLRDFPSSVEVLAECTPVYREIGGWHDAIPVGGTFKDLPTAARAYVAAVEEEIETPVIMVGTGVGRENAIWKK